MTIHVVFERLRPPKCSMPWWIWLVIHRQGSAVHMLNNAILGRMVSGIYREAVSFLNSCARRHPGHHSTTTDR